MSIVNNSSCLVQAQWDFADTSISPKFGIPFQVYRPHRLSLNAGAYEKVAVTDREVITSKSKLRGRGKAISLLFSTEAGKDCHIFGIGFKVNNNANS